MAIPYDRTTPHRFDVVGSFLRPQELRDARRAFEEGRLDQDQLTAVEDRAIRELVAREQQAGLGVITDGEFRRATWHLDFMWALDGVGHSPAKEGIPFHDEPALIDDTYLTGKVGLTGEHPFVGHFRFVQGLEDADTVAKQTLPAPAQVYQQFLFPANRQATRRFYATDQELADDVVAAYRAVVDQLYQAGCRNIQLDDCTWGVLVDPNATRVLDTDQAGVDRAKEDLLQVNNRVLEGLPADLTVNTHVCRGNFHSTWASQGGYGAVAEQLLARENVHAFFLEFDDERSGGFEPLASVPEDKVVVLGLVTTKTAQLEDRASVIERIHQAARYVPLDRLALSPQCGFASCEIGNKLTQDQQWAKVELVKSIAEEVWG